MDALSITASLLAVLGVLASSAEAALDIWDAPEELQRLSADLNELNQLASRLDALTRLRVIQEHELRSLAAPCLKLREAQKVFQERLSKRHGLDSPASRFRRRTWILHLPRIEKLTRGTKIYQYISTKYTKHTGPTKSDLDISRWASTKPLTFSD